jgi:peroxiredoxin
MDVQAHVASDIDHHPKTVQREVRPFNMLRNAVISAAIVIALGVVVFFGWWALAGLGTSSAPQIRAQVGSIAPDFELTDITTGQTVGLSKLRGKPVWVNFWATWCPPCAQEMPAMQTLYNQHRGSGLVLLGVDVQESDTAVRAFTRGKFDWTFLIDPDGKVVDRYMVGGLPTHFFIDKDGVIRAIYAGALSSDTSHSAAVDFHQYLSTILSK